MPERSSALNTPVVLSYGLGVDSTAILLRWLHEPASRNFDLADLIVITAMTGDEWPETGQLVETHILPLLRQHRVRYIQVARASGSQRDGVVILDDSRSPKLLDLHGAYKLSDELLTAGTVPQMGGVRKCSQKAKGWPLDTVIERTLGPGTHYRHVVGFEAEEPKRAERDVLAGKSPGRTGEYPLIEWGWDRATCERYITRHTGVAWLKSACVYCPFALGNKAGIARVLAQYRNNPDAARAALFVEHVALALNPLQGLAKDVRLVDLLNADGNELALDLLRAKLTYGGAKIYEIRRVLRPRKDDRTKLANAARSVRAVSEEMDYAGAVRRLRRYGPVISTIDGWFHRVHIAERSDVFPCVEHLYVVAPAVVADKQDPKFESWWLEAQQAVRWRAA